MRVLHDGKQRANFAVSFRMVNLLILYITDCLTSKTYWIMKTKYLFMIAAALFIFGCSGEPQAGYLEDKNSSDAGKSGTDTSDPTHEELLPPGSVAFPINLETKEIESGGEAGVFSVKSDDRGWHITGFRFIVDEDTVTEKNPLKTIPNDNGVLDHIVVPDTFAYDWVEAIKISNTELQVKLNENNSGKKREVWVGVDGPLLIGEELHITQEDK
jgi:hypothetical protein